MKSLFKENPLKKTLLVKHITPLSNGEGEAAQRAVRGWGFLELKHISNSQQSAMLLLIFGCQHSA